MLLARIGLALLAAAACAWFALGVRQARGTNRATAIVTSGATLSPAQRRQAAGLLHGAKLLNPDTEVDVLRAELELDTRNPAAARLILEHVVSEEPDNAVAWEWLARASVGDPRELFLATLRIRQLVPPVPLRMQG